MDCKIVHFRDVKQEVSGEPGVKVRWLIKKEDGAPNFAMRYFELEPNAKSPHHKHNWEHEVFILKGKCKVFCEGKEKKVGAGYVIFIPPNALHHFENIGKKPLCFLCLVPHKER